MRLGERHRAVLNVLRNYSKSGVGQISLDVAVRANIKIAAEMYAALDQLQTLGLVTTSRTSSADGDAWSLTPYGRTRRMELTR